MADIDKIKKSLREFRLMHENESLSEVLKKFDCLDAEISRFEKQLFNESHKQLVSKNIFLGSEKEKGKKLPAYYSSLNRNYGEKNKYFVIYSEIEGFYWESAEYFKNAGENDLADYAYQTAGMYSSPVYEGYRQKNDFEIFTLPSKNVFGRPAVVEGQIFFYDSPQGKGKKVYRYFGQENIEIWATFPDEVSGKVSGGEFFYFISTDSKTAYKTDKNGNLLKTIKIQNDPGNHFKADPCFNGDNFVVPSGNKLLFFDRSWKLVDELTLKHSKMVIDIETDGENLFCTNYDPERRTAEILKITPNGQTSCLYDGLYKPGDVTLIGENIISTDSHGVHLINTKSKERTVWADFRKLFKHYTNDTFMKVQLIARQNDRLLIFCYMFEGNEIGDQYTTVIDLKYEDIF